MTRRKLPHALTERRAFFAGRFDDVILVDGQIVVLPTAVMTVENKRGVVDYLLRRVGSEHRVSFLLGDSVVQGVDQQAFLDALMKVWPYCDSYAAVRRKAFNEMLHEFIRMLKTRAPGAIAQAFADSGVVFSGPGKP